MSLTLAKDRVMPDSRVDYTKILSPAVVGVNGKPRVLMDSRLFLCL